MYRTWARISRSLWVCLEFIQSVMSSKSYRHVLKKISIFRTPPVTVTPSTFNSEIIKRGVKTNPTRKIHATFLSF